MLDFCAKHGIVCDIEKINFDYVNTAMVRAPARSISGNCC
jgi:D-arabinose 1-dehydrogenase-like Zn-dependent alcohol dehydrogenase